MVVVVVVVVVMVVVVATFYSESHWQERHESHGGDLVEDSEDVVGSSIALGVREREGRGGY